MQEVATDHAEQTCRNSANMMSNPANTSKPTQATTQRPVRTSAVMLPMSASWGQSSSSTQKFTPQNTLYRYHRLANLGLSGEVDCHVGSKSLRLTHLDYLQCRHFSGIAVFMHLSTIAPNFCCYILCLVVVTALVAPLQYRPSLHCLELHCLELLYWELCNTTDDTCVATDLLTNVMF